MAWREAELQAFYDETSGYHAAQLAVGDRAFELIAAERSRKLQPLISENDSVLEYGVGTGLDLAHLRCAGRTGFDIVAHLAAEVGRRGIHFTSQTSSLPASTFDTVICHHALEHVPDPGQTLDEIQRLLRPCGRLLLFVPYEREWRYRRFRHDEPNHHLYSWNPQTLGNLVRSHGFSVESCGLGAYGYERFAAKLVTGWHGGLATYRALLRCLRMIRPVAEVRLVGRKAGLE